MGNYTYLYGLNKAVAFASDELQKQPVIADAKNFLPLLWSGCFRFSNLKWQRAREQEARDYALIVAESGAAIANLRSFARGLETDSEIRDHLRGPSNALILELKRFPAIQLDTAEFSYLFDDFVCLMRDIFEYVEDVADGRTAYGDIVKNGSAAFGASGIDVPELETAFGGKKNLEYMFCGLNQFYQK